MNFKKLLPIAFMAFGALVGCGKGGGGGKGGFPSTENEDGVHTVTVTNAAELGEEFRVDDRITLDLALTDDGEEKNPLVELNDGNLEILSSNESIITISGLVIEGAGVGEAKVAIKYYKTVKLFSFNVLEKMTNKIKYGTAHEGDAADPFTNEDALLVGAYIKENAIETTSDSFYIKGEVKSFYHAPGSRQDGACSWYLKPAQADGEKFEVYKCYKEGSGAASYLTEDDVWVGGETIITGKITTYGDQVETPSAKFVSCTGNKPDPKQTYEVTVAEALTVGLALDDGASTWDIYAVTGYVVLKDGSNYFLADSKTAATTDTKTLYEIYGAAAADEAKLLKGAKVKVTAQLKNYHGQVENNGTYTLELLEAGEEWVINYQEVTFAEALAAAKALENGAYSEGYYKTTAKVVKVTYAWSNGTMSLTINESGLEADETMTVYKMACTEEESAKVVAGATVTVGGKLQNYYNQSKDTHTYEFTSPVLLAVDDGQGGGGGEEEQALVADFSTKAVKHSTYADTWEYGDFVLAGAANNNGGWAFVKFGPKAETLSGDSFPGVWMKTKGAMANAISEIKIQFVGKCYNQENESAKVKVEAYSDAAFTTKVAETAEHEVAEISSNDGRILDTLAAPQTGFAAGLYYKVVFDIHNTTTYNGVVAVESITFVEAVA